MKDWIVRNPKIFDFVSCIQYLCRKHRERTGILERRMYVRSERVLGIAVLLYINCPMPISCTETNSSQIKIIYICTTGEG